MRALLIVGLAVAAIAVVAALECFARATRLLAVEPRLAPFVRRPAPTAVSRPADLVQLEHLLAEVAAGHEAARARLAQRLTAAGIVVSPTATAAELLATVSRLPVPHE